jgi:hypothetical protein
MPSSVVKSIAKHTGKSEAEVDKVWNETKKEADEKFPVRNASYWAYVNTTCHRKCGITEDVKLKFKSFIQMLSE